MKSFWFQIEEHRTFIGAAAFAFYSMLAIFPATIFLLSLLPYFPITDLNQLLDEIFKQALPESAFLLLSEVVHNLAIKEREGIVSFGWVFTLWVASSGINSCILQLNATYGIRGSRSYLRRRLVAIGLTLILATITLTTLSAIFFLENFFDYAKWVVAGAGTLLAFGITYSVGPDVRRKFRLISVGSFVGVSILAAASLIFKWYIENFGRFNATYGVIGAAIVLMMWLYSLGLAVLIGSEVDSFIYDSSKVVSKL